MKLKGNKVHEILEIPGTWTQRCNYRDHLGHATTQEMPVVGV